MDIEFYNWTSQIRYPFVHTDSMPTFNGGTVDLQDSWLVDAGILFYIDSEFDPELHSAWLYRINRVGAVVTFYFTSDAPGFTGPFILTATVGVTAYGAVLESELPGQGYIYINVGTFDNLAGNMIADSNILILPSNIQTLKDSFVTSIILCNDDRLVATPPVGCGTDDGSSSA